MSEITIDMMERVAAAEKHLGIQLTDDAAVALVEENLDNLYEMARDAIDRQVRDYVEEYAEAMPGGAQ